MGYSSGKNSSNLNVPPSNGDWKEEKQAGYRIQLNRRKQRRACRKPFVTQLVVRRPEIDCMYERAIQEWKENESLHRVDQPRLLGSNGHYSHLVQPVCLELVPASNAEFPSERNIGKPGRQGRVRLEEDFGNGEVKQRAHLNDSFRQNCHDFRNTSADLLQT